MVTSPGWRPDAPLLSAAAAAGIEVIGEVELAWRLQGHAAPAWLAVTGTNGKTTTVRMLASILGAAGLRTVATGNVGLPLLDAVLAPEGHAVLAVELSSFQLHWSRSLRPHSAVVLNVAPDHLDWHGSLAAYTADKGRIYAPGTVAVFSREDAASTQLAAAAATRVGCTLQAPERASSAGSTTSWSTGPFLTSLARRPSWPASPTCPCRARTTSPTPSQRRRWPAPTASRQRRYGPACARSCRTRTATRS